jgi:hypothetical protein
MQNDGTAGDEGQPRAYTVFRGATRIASGDLANVAVAAKRALDEAQTEPVLVFDRVTARVVDLDLRGTDAEVRARHAPAPSPARRGRPRLGVVAKEITLLPRHWDWLARQPGGASTTLRRLVEAARKTDAGGTDARARTEAAYRFMSAMAGNLPGFEEAARALFAADTARLAELAEPWPPDIRDEALRFLDARDS